MKGKRSRKRFSQRSALKNRAKGLLRPKIAFVKRRRQSPTELRFKKVRILRDCLRPVCQESKIGINRQPLHKFMKRFTYIEEALSRQNKTWQEMDLPGLDQLWQEAKTKE